MDVTGSTNTVDVMFEHAAQILNEQRMDPQSLQLQLVVYRKYSGAQDKLLPSSTLAN